VDGEPRVTIRSSSENDDDGTKYGCEHGEDSFESICCYIILLFLLLLLVYCDHEISCRSPTILDRKTIYWIPAQRRGNPLVEWNWPDGMAEYYTGHVADDDRITTDATGNSSSRCHEKKVQVGRIWVILNAVELFETIPLLDAQGHGREDLERMQKGRERARRICRRSTCVSSGTKTQKIIHKVYHAEECIVTLPFETFGERLITKPCAQSMNE